MNTDYRKNLPGSALDYFDARAAVDAIQPGAYATLPYTRACWPRTWCAAAIRPRSAIRWQLIERRRDLDFPWFPARVVCHDPRPDRTG